MLDAFAARAIARAATVLRARCDDLERAMPLQVLFDAIEAHLRTLGSERARAVLGEHGALLGPLLHAPTARTTGAALADAMTGPTRLYGALLDVLQASITQNGNATGEVLVMLLDDMHLAADSTVEWFRFATRWGPALPVLVVAARRPDLGPPIAASTRVELGPLDLVATAEIVGAERALELHARSGDHRLFLVELAAAGPGERLPASIRDSVAERCEQSGEAATTLRAAALLGDPIEFDVLAAILQCAPLRLLGHLEEGVRRRLVVERGDRFAFAHDLVRKALVATTPATFAAFVHREAGRALAARSGADPLEIAHHARLGGDRELAADSLVRAAHLAVERFDHAVAERLLDEAIEGAPTGAHLSVERARVRTLRGDYAGARVDVEAAVDAGAGADAFEVAAWAAYFARNLSTARRAADDAVRTATDPVTRTGCLTIAGRIRHAVGDLAGADDRLSEALALAEGPSVPIASVWLGSLRSHQSRVGEAIELLETARRSATPGRQIASRFNAVFFSAHAHGLAGHVAEALSACDETQREVERSRLARFAGRAENFRAWLLNGIGLLDAAEQESLTALRLDLPLVPETRISAHLDLADGYLHRQRLDDALHHLELAARVPHKDLVFGWRLRLKAELHRARAELLAGRFAEAERRAVAIAADARARDVPRYAVPAELLALRASARRGVAVDLGPVRALLDDLEDAIALEAWWLTAELARDLGVTAWWGRAERLAHELAAGAGGRADEARRGVGVRLEEIEARP